MFTSLRLVRVVVLALLAAGCAGEPGSARDLLKQLGREDDPAARTAMIDRFLERRGGNPVVDQNARLTFFVKDDGSGRQARLVGDFNAWATGPQGYDATAGALTPIAGTPWSYAEATAFTNARLEYVMLYAKEAVPDPRNGRRIRTFSGERSEIRMPFFTAHPEVEGPDAAAGVITEQVFTSTALRSTRKVWTYVPAGYAESDALYPTVYFLDGGNYTGWMEVPKVLDRLIAAGTLPPFIGVFVEPADRQEEYSRNPAWRSFIATELVPAIDRTLRTFPAPEQRLIFGSSLGAYGAVDLAVAYSNVFGLCAALSPPAQASTLLTNQSQGQRAIHGVRFYVLGATYDTDVKGARTLRTALAEASADVTYEEVPEGHAAETFRTHIDNALKVLLPAPVP